MRASDGRRTSGTVFLGGAATATAVGVYTLVFRDDGPVGSYVALAVALAGTAVVLLATSGSRKGLGRAYRASRCRVGQWQTGLPRGW